MATTCELIRTFSTRKNQKEPRASCTLFEQKILKASLFVLNQGNLWHPVCVLWKSVLVDNIFLSTDKSDIKRNIVSSSSFAGTITTIRNKDVQLFFNNCQLYKENSGQGQKPIQSRVVKAHFPFEWKNCKNTSKRNHT